MLIQCPRCETIFRLDENLLGEEGSNVRCSRCTHVFWTKQPNEPPGVPPLSPQEEGKTTSDELLESEEGPFLRPSEEQLVASIRRSSRKRVWGLVGFFIVLFLLTVTVRYSYLQWKNPHQEFLDIFKQVFFVSSDPKWNKKIRLVEVRGYFKTSPKEGRFFVVEGKVQNGYRDPRNEIRLRGSVRDGAKQVIATREIVAGRTIPLEELEKQPLTELIKLLESPISPFASSLLLAPEASAPFMIIFPPTSHPLSEFSVEVLESKKGVLGVASAH